MSNNALVPLIELTRGGYAECTHFGAIAVANARGTVRAQAGDADFVTFTRSTLKAFQALPFVEAGGVQRFGFSMPEVAMLCASHNGEAKHVAAVESMLGKSGSSYQRLRCGCGVPGLYSLMDKSAPEGLQFDERHHNCSGKHAGFVAHCVGQGWRVEDYTDPAHPLQQAVAKDVARAVGMEVPAMRMGIDGCSAPNFAIPLSKLAYGYARLASGTRDAEFGASFALLGEAMSAHPDMVSGTGRNDAAFMEAGRGDWVTKIGADGVQVIASKSRCEALAIKISDGNKTALYAAAVEALEQLGWLDDVQRAALAPWRASDILSARGAVVGQRRPAFRLQAV